MTMLIIESGTMPRLLMSLCAALCLADFADGVEFNPSCKNLKAKLTMETITCFNDYIQAVTSSMRNNSTSRCATVEHYVEQLRGMFAAEAAGAAAGAAGAQCRAPGAARARAAAAALDFRIDFARRLHPALLAFAKSDGPRCINDNRNKIYKCRANVLPFIKKKMQNVMARTTITHAYDKGAFEDSVRMNKCIVNILRRQNCSEAATFNAGVHEVIRQIVTEEYLDSDNGEESQNDDNQVRRLRVMLVHL